MDPWGTVKVLHREKMQYVANRIVFLNYVKMFFFSLFVYF